MYKQPTETEIQAEIDKVDVSSVITICGLATRVQELGGMDSINAEYVEGSTIAVLFDELVELVDNHLEQWGCCELTKRYLPMFNY